MCFAYERYSNDILNLSPPPRLAFPAGEKNLLAKGGVEHQAWFIQLLANEREGKSIPCGHFRRGTQVTLHTARIGVSTTRPKR
jgi:hypothetical protein